MVIACIEHALQLARFDKHRAVQKPRVLCLPFFIKDKSHLFALHKNSAFSAAASDCALADVYERNNSSFRTAVVIEEKSYAICILCFLICCSCLNIIYDQFLPCLVLLQLENYLLPIFYLV